MALRLTCTLLLAIVCQWGASAPQASAADTAEIAAARAELELARGRLWQFDQVEYPLELRRLNDAIRFAEAEIDSIEYRLDEYEPFTRVKYGSPLVTTLQDLRLALLDAEQHYRQLREERMLLVRLRPARREALLQEIAVAEALLAAYSQ